MTSKGLYAAIPHIERRNAYRELIGAKHVQRK